MGSSPYDQAPQISLFSRDCSVQCRRQKVIEGAPVTITKQETFEAMERAGQARRIYQRKNCRV